MSTSVDPVWGASQAGATNPMSGTSSKKSNSVLDMSDFLKLMAAQFKNQNIDSQTDNTQYITELAQFSAIQAMDSMAQNSGKETAMALVGQNVVLSVPDKTTGKTSLKAGTVEKACYDTDGKSYLILKGAEDQYFDVSNVTEVLGFPSVAATDESKNASSNSSNSNDGSKST